MPSLFTLHFFFCCFGCSVAVLAAPSGQFQITDVEAPNPDAVYQFYQVPSDGVVGAFASVLYPFIPMFMA